jgi:cell division protein FtsQ
VVKRALAGFVLALVIIAIGVAGYYASRPGMFPIKTVEVQGNYQFVTKQAIAETVMPFLGKGFFYVPVVEAQEALNQLPGVKESTIRRIWPDTVEVTLIEQTTIGRWSDGRLLTDEGVLFTPVSPSIGSTLPLFVGPESDTGMMAEVYEQLQPVLKNAPFALNNYTYQPGAGWTVMTQDNVMIILGSTRWVVPRLARLVAAYPQLLASNSKQMLTYVDMQYKNGFAASWKPKPKPTSMQKR